MATKEDLTQYLYNVVDQYGIDRDIAFKQISQESKFNPSAKSGAGAVGIAQFTAGTGRRYGLVINNQVDERLDPFKSLDAYGAYMSDLLEMFDYRYDIALAGYNSGEFRSEYQNAYEQGRGINWAVLPPRVQTETRSYVRIILGDSDHPITLRPKNPPDGAHKRKKRKKKTNHPRGNS